MTKRSKKYKKMFKEHKSKVMGVAKIASNNPYHYEFGLDMLIAHMEFMRDYYKLGENVHGVDNTKLTRLESLNYVLDLYYKWVEFDNKYEVSNNDTNRIDDWFIEGSLPDSRHDKINYNKDYIRARNNFFKALSKYIEEWWD